MVASLERSLQPEGAGASMPPARRAQLHYGLGQLHLYYGRMDEAIAQFQRASRLVAGTTSPGSEASEDASDFATQLEEALGVAYLVDTILNR